MSKYNIKIYDNESDSQIYSKENKNLNEVKKK